MQQTQTTTGVILADAGHWLSAQARQGHTLAITAREVGRLEAMLAALPDPEAQGARQRLALVEVEAMLWAQGMVVRGDEVGRDLMDARAGSDPQALRVARWAVRRLEGQGGLIDLPSFLGLHRGDMRGEPLPGFDLRLQRDDFDAAAAEFAMAVESLEELHTFARGPALMALWRMAELSPPGNVIEPAIWSARHMAFGAEGLRFIPLGRHGRRIWTGSGSPEDRLTAHLAAMGAAAREARAAAIRLQVWAEYACAATVGIKGGNAACVIRVLTTRPMVSAMDIESLARISRPTAERMLKRLAELGLIREVTGLAASGCGQQRPERWFGKSEQPG